MSNRYTSQFASSLEHRVVEYVGVVSITGSTGLPVDALSINGLSCSKESTGVWRFDAYKDLRVPPGGAGKAVNRPEYFSALLSLRAEHVCSHSLAGDDQRAMDSVHIEPISLITSSSVALVNASGSNNSPQDNTNVSGFKLGMLMSGTAYIDPFQGDTAATSLQHILVKAVFRNYGAKQR